MRILRSPEVQSRAGYSGMHLSRLEKAGKFPKRIKLGPNSVGWLEEEVDDWIAQKMAARDEEEASKVKAAEAETEKNEAGG